MKGTARTRVLVVAATFPPDGGVGGLRTMRLLKHLAPGGSDIEVLTVSPDTYRAGTVIDNELLLAGSGSVRVIRARALRPFERLASSLRRVGRLGPESRPSARQPAGASAGGIRPTRRPRAAPPGLPCDAGVARSRRQLDRPCHRCRIGVYQSAWRARHHLLFRSALLCTRSGRLPGGVHEATVGCRLSRPLGSSALEGRPLSIREARMVLF